MPPNLVTQVRLMSYVDVTAPRSRQQLKQESIATCLKLIFKALCSICQGAYTFLSMHRVTGNEGFMRKREIQRGEIVCRLTYNQKHDRFSGATLYIAAGGGLAYVITQPMYCLTKWRLYHPGNKTCYPSISDA